MAYFITQLFPFAQTFHLRRNNYRSVFIDTRHAVQGIIRLRNAETNHRIETFRKVADAV